MTDEEIKEILIGTQDYMLSRLPKTEDNHEYSPKFRRNMKKLIERDKHQARYYAIRIAAVVFLMLGLAGGLILGFNEEARAQVMRWIAERFADNGYRYHKEKGQNVGIIDYSLDGLLTDEYQLFKRTEKDNQVNEIYTDSRNTFLVFSVCNAEYEGELVITSSQNILKEEAYIGKEKANLYLSENSDEPNVIVWQGADGKLFTIQGYLTRDELIDLAEKVNKK